MDNENRWKYDQVDISLIDEAEMNANEMTGEDFAALCDNIGKSGLSSVPCCYKKQDGRFVMISGHHRLRACKKLRYSKIGILYCDEDELTKDEIIAIQLSHNSLMKETFTFSIILYPNSFDALDSLFGDIREQAKKSDIVLIADHEPNEEMLLKLQKEIGDQFNIKSPAICFSKLLDLAKERLTEIQKDNDLGNSES